MRRSLENIHDTAAAIAAGNYNHEDPYKVLKVLAELVEGLTQAAMILNEGQSQSCELDVFIDDVDPAHR